MRGEERSIRRVILDVDLLSKTIGFAQRETTKMLSIESSRLRRTEKSRSCTQGKSSVSYRTRSHHQIVFGSHQPEGQTKGILITLACELQPYLERKSKAEEKTYLIEDGMTIIDQFSEIQGIPDTCLIHEHG
jgi:hypothetical protein